MTKKYQNDSWMLLIVTLSFFILSGCSRNTKLNTQTGTDLMLMAGNNQNGLANLLLGAPLSVTVVDSNKKPLPNTLVNWSVTQGDGKLSASQSLTDQMGVAQITVTLGASEPQTQISASLPGLNSTIVFSEKSVPASSTTLTLISGNNQSGLAGSALPQPLVVMILDNNKNPIAGVPISWSVVTGNGTLSAQTLITDSNGQAQANFTLGTISGSNQVNVSTTLDIPNNTQSFQLTGQPGSPAKIILTPAQMGVASGTTVAIAGTVQDQFGNLLPNISIILTSTLGTLQSAGETSNAQGALLYHLTLSGTVGSNATLSAVVPNSTPEVSSTTMITIDASGPENSIALVSGNTQTVSAGQSLNPLVVKVSDSAGNGVNGATVAWVGSSGYQTTTTTSTDGTSSLVTSFTTAGPGTLEASIPTSSTNNFFIFKYQIDAAAAAKFYLINTTAQSNFFSNFWLSGIHCTLAGVAIPYPIALSITDVYSNVVPNQSITWSIASGNGALSDIQTNTGPTGTTSAFYAPPLDNVGTTFKFSVSAPNLNIAPLIFTIKTGSIYLGSRTYSDAPTCLELALWLNEPAFQPTIFELVAKSGASKVALAPQNYPGESPASNNCTTVENNTLSCLYESCTSGSSCTTNNSERITVPATGPFLYVGAP